MSEPITNVRREEQLRRSLLDSARRLGAREATGFVSGSKLAIDAHDDRGSPVDGEAQAISLLGDVVRLELLTEKSGQPTGGIGPRELRHRLYKLTDKGWHLLLGQIDPMPGIAGRDE